MRRHLAPTSLWALLSLISSLACEAGIRERRTYDIAADLADGIDGQEMVLTGKSLMWDVWGDFPLICALDLESGTSRLVKVNTDFGHNRDERILRLLGGTDAHLLIWIEDRGLFLVRISTPADGGVGETIRLDPASLGLSRPYQVLAVGEWMLVGAFVGGSSSFGDCGSGDPAACLGVLEVPLEQFATLINPGPDTPEVPPGVISPGWILGGDTEALYSGELMKQGVGQPPTCTVSARKPSSNAPAAVILEEPSVSAGLVRHDCPSHRSVGSWLFSQAGSTIVAPIIFRGSSRVLDPNSQVAVEVRDLRREDVWQIFGPPTEYHIGSFHLLADRVVFRLGARLYEAVNAPGGVAEPFGRSPGRQIAPVSNAEWLAWVDDAREVKDVYLMNKQSEEVRCITCDLDQDADGTPDQLE